MTQAFLMNMTTHEAEQGPGSVADMVFEANALIEDDTAKASELVIATVTHTFMQPPAVAVKVDTDTMPSTIAEVEAKTAGITNA